MKKLLALGISNILYMRGLLPEHAFGERMVGGNYCNGIISQADHRLYYIVVNHSYIALRWPM